MNERNDSHGRRATGRKALAGTLSLTMLLTSASLAYALAGEATAMGRVWAESEADDASQTGTDLDLRVASNMGVISDAPVAAMPPSDSAAADASSSRGAGAIVAGESNIKLDGFSCGDGHTSLASGAVLSEANSAVTFSATDPDGALSASGISILDTDGKSVLGDGGEPLVPQRVGKAGDAVTFRVMLPAGTYGALQFRATDGKGNVGFKTFTNVRVDVEPPTIGPATYGPDGSALVGGEALAAGNNVITCSVDDDGGAVDPANVTVVLKADGTDPVEMHPEAGDAGAYSLSLPDGTYSAIEIRATDAAGNQATSSYSNVLVDTVKPAVELSFGDGQERGFFRHARTLTVKVTEANFDPSLASIDITPMKGEPQVISDGVIGEGHWADGGDGTYTYRLAVRGDGRYSERSVTVTGTDKVGNPFDAGSQTVTPFVIDTTAPKVEVSYDDDPDGNGFYSTPRTMVVKVTEESFEPSRFTVRINRTEGDDADSQIVRDAEFGRGHWTRGWDGAYTLRIPVETDGSYAANCVTVTGTDGAGNAIEGSAEDGTYTPQLTLFVIDQTAPVVTVSYDGPEAKHIDAADGAGYYDAARTMAVSVADRNFDPSGLQVVIKRSSSDSEDDDVLALEADASKWTRVEGTDAYTLTVADEIAADGRYEVSVAGTADKAGNQVQVSRADSDLAPFVVDTVAPVVTVSYDGPEAKHTDAADGTGYYDAARTMTISVADRNFDPSGLQVNVSRTDSARCHGPENVSSAALGEWAKVGDVYTLTIAQPIADDGRYSVEVAGTADKVAHGVDIFGASDLASFIVDTVAPEVTVTLQLARTTGPDGLRYYNAPTTVVVTVRDRNLDVGQCAAAISNGMVSIAPVGSEGWTSARADDGNVTYSTTVAYDELPDAQAGEASYTPRINAVDLVGRNSASKGDQDIPFYVDCTAPQVISSSTSGRPANTADSENYQFYNQATSVVIGLKDSYGLGSAVLFDPDGEYNLDNQIARGERGTYTITVPLVDGAQRSHDTEYQRNVVLEVRDVAGNVRDWNIGPDGSVADVRGSSAANSPLVVSGVSNGHPTNLVEDVTRPDIQMSGVTAGTYYNSDQSVHVLVNEFNFAYLRRFGSMRSVVIVTKQEGNAGRAQSSWDILAASFAGSGSTWACDQAFDSDGHYTLTSHFFDIANNESNTCTIGEFTIDKTAPVLAVAWDNDDVRNGRYYDADRTATITVEEHNFDPSLFAISTDGSISGWSASGDTHTCTVRFGEGQDHTLSVSGQDMAGNAATDYSEPTFTIDKTLPTVEIGGTAVRYDRNSDDPKADAGDGMLHDRNAYNGAVCPVITFTDNANLDVDGSEVDGFVGAKHESSVTSTFLSDEAAANNQKVVTYRDLGYFGQGTSDADDVTLTHDINADDVYTIHATAIDLAGNKTDAELRFSVNRFGSNYVEATMLDAQGNAIGDGKKMLSDSPYVTFKEINVSGSRPEADANSVIKEYANATSTIEANQDVAMPSGDSPDVRPRGYSLTTAIGSDGGADDDAQADGWAEYTYVIGNGNFGTGSPSDTNGDGGQGNYYVNVSSADTAGNVNISTNYLAPRGTDNDGDTNADPKQATVQFRLDQVAPSIDQVDVPRGLTVGGDYTVRFHVTDTVDDPSNPDKVMVKYDGDDCEVVPSADAEGLVSDASGTGKAKVIDEGDGNYRLVVNGRPFKVQSVELDVTDWNGRSARTRDDSYTYRFYLSTLRLEVGLVAAAAAAVAAVLYVRRRRGRPEPGRRRPSAIASRRGGA